MFCKLYELHIESLNERKGEDRMKRIISIVLILMMLVSVSALADVAKGAKGDEVKQIQQRLVDLGYLTGKVDGVFGGMTEDAVKTFQKTMGLQDTGIVDHATSKKLFDPNIHASYFTKMRFADDMRLAADSSSGLGVNNKGKSVEYMMYFIIPREEWMTEDPKITFDWTDSAINSNTTMDMWQSAKKGETGYYIAYSENIYTYINEIWIYVILPDDPSIAGRHCIEFESMGYVADAYFNLEYKGNYVDGSGWKVSHMEIEQKHEDVYNISSPALPTSKSVQEEHDYLNAKEALETMSISECIHYADRSEKTYYVGRNSDGVEIGYGIWALVDGCPYKINLSSVSWTDSLNYNDNYQPAVAWEYSKKGSTEVFDGYSEFEVDGKEIKQNSIELYLPDNPSIEGEQWLTFICEDYRALVNIKLTYLGDYIKGKGWRIDILNRTISQIQ